MYFATQPNPKPQTPLSGFADRKYIGTVQDKFLMIGRYSARVNNKLVRMFAAESKAKMEVTLRSPYKTFLNNFDGFSRIIARTNEGSLVIQSKQPAGAYVILPGSLKIQFTEEKKDLTGDFIHSGGFVVIHPNNTVEISLIECFEKRDVDGSKIGEVDLPDAGDSLAGKYVEKIRSQAKKDYLRYV